jgi:hypothetical protein
MVDSRQYWMDQVLRQVAEENMNPEVLSGDFGDPRFSRRPMEPEFRPFMGDWVPDLADKIGSGISGAARWVDKNVPSIDSPVDAEFLASFIEPLRGSDLGATGTHAGDVYPGVPKAAGMVIGPALKYTPKMIKRLFGGADEVVDTGTQVGKETKQLEMFAHQRELDVRGLTQKQYDELQKRGLGHQEIMDEHPVLPSSQWTNRAPRPPKPEFDNLVIRPVKQYHMGDRVTSYDISGKTFTTDRGSVYKLTDDGKWYRQKSEEAERIIGGKGGPQPSMDEYYMVPEEQVADVYTYAKQTNTSPIRIHGDGRVSIKARKVVGEKRPTRDMTPSEAGGRPVIKMNPAENVYEDYWVDGWEFFNPNSPNPLNKNIPMTPFGVNLT